MYSSYFGVSNVVKQGETFSPKLFSVYFDDLSLALSGAKKTGCIINSISLNHVFHANDSCITTIDWYVLLLQYTQPSIRLIPLNLSVLYIKPSKFKVYCLTMILNSVPILNADSVQYMGYVFTPDFKDDIDMLR